MNKNHHFLVSSLYFTLFLVWVNITKNNADQSTNLFNLLKSKRSQSPDLSASWAEFRAQIDSVRVHVGSQDGLMQSDKVTALPGQPDGVDFDQYAGYVTVDPDAGKELFYYFVECPHNSSSKPLVLWLNGGPGCSSFGNGALQELGPFRVNSDGKSLFLNHYGWHHLANVIFLESPAGVGFSYGKNSSKIYGETGDTSTAKDSYAFLVNWLERFPQYKSRDFYITGESYAGHYIPQLAYTILQHNKAANRTFINLKAVALGNAWIDDAASSAGLYDFLWTHALYSDGTHSQLLQYCSDFSNATSLMSDACNDASQKALNEIGSIDIYNIYAPLCSNPALSKSPTLSSVEVYDPCSSTYVDAYLNIPEVQKALHARPTNWSACSGFDWKDSPSTVLPVVRRLMDSNVSVWVYSGDVDGRVPVTSSKYAINKLKLPIKTPWRPWYFSKQVGGYVVEYEGLAFVTVRGAGHLAPTYQPQRAFEMISSFLNGTLPPPQ